MTLHAHLSGNERLIVLLLSFCLLAGCYQPPAPSEPITWDLTELTASGSTQDNQQDLAAPSAVAPSARAGTPDERDEPSAGNAASTGEVQLCVVNDKPWIANERLPWQADYVQYQQGKQIGFSQVDIQETYGELKIVRTDWTLTRSGSELGKYKWITHSLISTETRMGEMRKFTLIRDDGVERKTLESRMQNSKIAVHATVERVGAEPEKTIDKSFVWPQGAWGTLGVQSLLMRDPMQPGEKRVAAIFVPGLNQIAEVQMIAEARELTPLAGGQAPELLPIDILILTTNGENQPVGTQSRSWVNDNGEIEKTIELNGGRVTTFRVDRKTTDRLVSSVEMEVLLEELRGKPMSLSLPVGMRWDEQSPNDSVFQIRMEGADPASVFARTSVQRIESLDARTAKVSVRPASLDSAKYTNDNAVWRDSSVPSAVDLGTSPWVRPDHVLMKEMADELAASDASPAAVAESLTRGVAARLELLELDSSPPNAFNAMASGAGDCFDHAALLAALLRFREIPARLVAGMRVVEPDVPKLEFWIWTEAWIDERWIPLDATQGSPTGRGYLAIERSAVGDENPYAAILSALKRLSVITRVELQKSP